MKPNIIKIAILIIDKEKENSIKNYFKSDKNLTVQWIPCDEFIAYADIDELGGNNYSINISYGVPISLYLEASTFLRMCTIEYKKSQYDILFNTFDYGEGRENIFPKELTGDSLKLLFFNYSFLWIYYHEQSHILQQHANIYSKHALHNEYMGICNTQWNDSSNENETKLNGKNAELKHTFELSADHEAIYHIIGNFIINRGFISISDIWVFTVCLNCIYNDFYGNKHEYNDKEATGTHPNPVIRMRLALSNIHNILSYNGMEKFFEKEKSYQDYLNAILHANDVSTFYIAHMYHKDLKPEFVTKLNEINTGSLYYQNIAKRWNEIREDIKAEYLGLDDFPFMNL